MGRLWLAVLVALCGSAHAEVARCECPSSEILPEPGAKDVPINTKAWAFGTTAELRFSGGSRDWNVSGGNASDPSIPVETISLPDVKSDHLYHLTGDGIETWFTTGHLEDNTPPVQPQIGAISLSVMAEPGVRMRVATFTLSARYDDDTALVRVTIEDSVGPVSFLLPAHHWFLCNPGIMVAPGKAKVSIVAVDLAGNYSMPTTTTVDVVVDPDADDRCSEHPRKGCGLGDTMAAVFGGALVLGLLLAILVITAIRYARISRTPGEPVSLLIAEDAARATLRRTVIAAAIELSAMSASFALDHELVAVAIALIASIDLLASRSVRSFLRALEYPGTTAELRSRTLVAHIERREYRIGVSRRAIRAARRAAVPAALRL